MCAGGGGYLSKFKKNLYNLNFYYFQKKNYFLKNKKMKKIKQKSEKKLGKGRGRP